MMFRHASALCINTLALLCCSACNTTPSSSVARTAHIPLLTGWFEGQQVFYVTTDVSDAAIAAAKGANFAPLLANAIGRSSSSASAVDRVYAVTNFDQPSVFASAPDPAGAHNRSLAYTPLWRLAKVTWRRPSDARTFRSEEDILSAMDSDEVEVELSDVVLNCPIVHLGSKGGLPGVSVEAAKD